MATNPAARVHGILSKAVGGRHSENAAASQIWGSVLGVDPGDAGEIYRKLLILFEQIEKVKALVTRVQGVDHQLYLEPLQNIEKAFAKVTIETQFKSFVHHLGGMATVNNLRYTVDLLNKWYPSSDIPKETLDELKKEAEALSKEVTKADIDETLKTGLLEHIERFRRAILEYQLKGPEGVVETLNLNLGFLIISQKTTQAGKARTVINKVGTFIVSSYNKVKIAIGLTQLPGDIAEVLQLTSGDPPA